MSYRFSQLSPRTSTRGLTMRMALRGPWSDAGSSPDAKFLQSWLEQDSDAYEEPPGRTNWGMFAGIVLAIGVSAAFWAGVGWVISRI
jgi:hypothetical protein